jgi:carbon monoxide dehydrogenase subunit G
VAHYNASVTTSQPLETVFAYMSDFTTNREWDPGTVEATRIGDGEIGVGTQFRIVAEFMGRRTPLTYTVTEFEPPTAITLRGENATVVSLDRMTFAPAGDATVVTYDADLALKGAAKLDEPLMVLAFRRIGDRALAGLRDTFARQERS